MSKRPAFMFYPADWRNSANLRRCSHAARGAWMDIMCVLHDSDVYGVVRWPLADLGNAANTPLKLVKELVSKGVLKGCDHGQCEPYTYAPKSGRKVGPAVTLIPSQSGPVWFSSRMVRDEYVRHVRGESTRFTPDENPSPNAAPMPSIGERQGDGSSYSVSFSVSESTKANAFAAVAAGLTNAVNGHRTGSTPDPKSWLFRDGVGWLVKATGRPEKAMRSLLGKWLKAAKEDAALLRNVFEAAQEADVAEPVAWITAAIASRAKAATPFEPADEHEWRQRFQSFKANGEQAWPAKWGGARPGDHPAHPAAVLAEFSFSTAPPHQGRGPSIPAALTPPASPK